MEHWAFEREVLKMYAKHYETGEVIPNELINKINALTESSASDMAELGGLSLKVSDSGKIELDITQEALEVLQGGGGGGVPEGFVEQRYNALVNGISTGTVFLVKVE